MSWLDNHYVMTVTFCSAIHLGDHVRRRAARFEPSPGKAVEMQTKLDGILRARPDADRPTAVVFGAAGMRTYVRLTCP